MTTEPTPFGATTPNNEVTPQVSTPIIPPEVAELVGQGKKYATVEEALKSVPHAQNHIKTLTEELQAAKAELEKRRTAEQLLDEIKSGIKPVEQPSTSPISPDSVAQMVQAVLTQKQQQEVSTKNLELVTGTFSAKFGEKAEEVYISLAKENGMSVEHLNMLSKEAPAAVLKLAGLVEPTKVAGKLDSSVNTSSMKQQTPNDLSARVEKGGSTKNLVSAWQRAGQKVGKPS